MTEPNPKPSEILQFAQNLVSLVVAIGVLIPAAGFVVFHINLSRYTDLYSFDAKTNFYVIAGFSMFIAMSLIFACLWLGVRFGKIADDSTNKLIVNKRKRTQILYSIDVFLIGGLILINYFQSALLFFVAMGMGLVPLIIAFMLSGLSTTDKGTNKLRIFFEALFNPFKLFSTIAKNPFTMTTVFLILFSVYYTLLIGSTYAQIIYRIIWSSAGGGNFSTVTMVFNRPDELSAFGLTKENGRDNQTATLCLLTELNDGYLVFDPNSQTTFKIPDEVISGFIDTRVEIPCDPPKPNSQGNLPPLIPTSTAEITPISP